MGVWLRVLGLEDPVPLSEEAGRARERVRAQVLVVE